MNPAVGNYSKTKFSCYLESSDLEADIEFVLSLNLSITRIIAFFALILILGSNAFANVKLVQLIKANRFDEARQLLQTNGARSVHKYHLEGLISKQEGDLAKAVEHFKRALTLQPNYKPSKRELAHTLFLLKDFDASKLHFEELAEHSTSAQEVSSYNRYLKAIKSKRPYGITGFFSFLPSSNVNKGSAHETFDSGLGVLTIDEASQARSGIGISAGLSGFYRYDLDEKYQLLFSGSLNARVYKNTEANSVNTSLSLEIGKQFDAGRLFVGATYGSSYGQDEDARPLVDLHGSVVRMGGKIRGNYKFTPRSNFYFNASAQRQDFIGREYRNGNLYSASLTHSYTLSPILYLKLGAGIVRETAETENLQHTDYKGSIGLTKKWTNGLVSAANFSYETHRYDENFVGLTKPRRDRKMVGSVSLVNPEIKYFGFAPKLTYSYTRQISNIEFYDYDSHDVGLTFTKDF